MGAQGVSSVDNLVLGKPTVEPGQSCTNAVDAVGEKPVGDAGKAVLFLNQRGNAQTHGLVEEWATCKAAHSDDSLRLVSTKHSARLPKAAHEFEREAQVAGACQGAVNATDPQAVDVVPRRGNLVHFHPPQSTDKPDVCLGVSPLDFIRNGQGGMDVPPGPSSGDNDVVQFGHQVSVLPPVLAPAVAPPLATIRVTASIMPMDRQVKSNDVPP